MSAKERARISLVIKKVASLLGENDDEGNSSLCKTAAACSGGVSSGLEKVGFLAASAVYIFRSDACIVDKQNSQRGAKTRNDEM
jgi:hypothetical protein